MAKGQDSWSPCHPDSVQVMHEAHRTLARISQLEWRIHWRHWFIGHRPEEGCYRQASSVIGPPESRGAWERRTTGCWHNCHYS